MTSKLEQTAFDLFTQLREEIGEAECLKIHPNKYQQAFIADTGAEKFAFGGNRSGKTLTLIYILFLMSCGLYAPRGKKSKKRYQVWLSSLDANMTKQVIVPLLRKVIPQAWLRVNENRNWAKINSSFGISIKIDFKSADSGREKYQGASVDLVGLDEEHPEDIYKECLMRVLDCGGQVLTTMTPLKGMTWIYDYSRQHFNITLPTAANPILKQADIDMLTAGFTEKEKRMRLLGEFVDLNGSAFLDADDRNYVERCVDSAIKRYSWKDDDKFIADEAGEYHVYRERKDKAGKVFIVSCDPATGSGQDYTVIDVWENSEKLEHIAQFRSNTTKLPQIPKIIKHIAEEYNHATVNIDRTGGTGEGVLQALVDTGYYNISGRENLERFTTQDKVGFTFTTHNRNIATIELRKRIQNRTIVMRSKQGYQELSLYRYDLKKGGYDHPRQSNDDCIMSAVIATMTARLLPISQVVESKKRKFFSFIEGGMTWNDLMAYEQKIENQRADSEDYD